MSESRAGSIDNQWEIKARSSAISAAVGRDGMEREEGEEEEEEERSAITLALDPPSLILLLSSLSLSFLSLSSPLFFHTNHGCFAIIHCRTARKTVLEQSREKEKKGLGRKGDEGERREKAVDTSPPVAAAAAAAAAAATTAAAAEDVEEEDAFDRRFTLASVGATRTDPLSCVFCTKYLSAGSERCRNPRFERPKEEEKLHRRARWEGGGRRESVEEECFFLREELPSLSRELLLLLRLLLTFRLLFLPLRNDAR